MFSCDSIDLAHDSWMVALGALLMLESLKFAIFLPTYFSDLLTLPKNGLIENSNVFCDFATNIEILPN